MPRSFLQRVGRAVDSLNPRDLVSFGGRIVGRRFITNVGEPQKTYMWEISMLSDRDPLDNMLFYGRTVTVPETQNEPVVKEYMGQRFFYSGKDMSSNVCTITFWDDQELTIYKYFKLWSQKLHVPIDGSKAFKHNYTKDFIISLKDNLDLFRTGVFTLKSAYPINIPEIQMSYDDNNVIEVSVTLQYDLMVVR